MLGNRIADGDPGSLTAGRPGERAGARLPVDGDRLSVAGMDGATGHPVPGQ